MISIKVDRMNALIKKAKTKKDGVFSSAPFKYVVKNGVLLYIGDKISGNISMVTSGFMMEVGKVRNYELEEELKNLLNKL